MNAKEHEVERLGKLFSSTGPGITPTMEDEIAGILYSNSTNESDDGKWIEAKDYYRVAKLISDHYQHLLLETRHRLKVAREAMTSIDKGFYNHKLTIREAQQIARETLEATK